MQCRRCHHNRVYLETGLCGECERADKASTPAPLVTQHTPEPDDRYYIPEVGIGHATVSDGTKRFVLYNAVNAEELVTELNSLRSQRDALLEIARAVVSMESEPDEDGRRWYSVVGPDLVEAARSAIASAKGST